jgi:hypothetical protein
MRPKQAYFCAELGDNTIRPVASIVLTIDFKNKEFCNSWCPLRSDRFPKKTCREGVDRIIRKTDGLWT